MTTKPKVLLLGTIESDTKEWAKLQEIADIVTPTSQSRDAFLAECRSGALDGVVAAYRTFSSVNVTGLVDRELVEALPRSLGFISHNGAGYDQIDVSACTARNILVSNVPTAVDDATADTAIFLLLGALRGFNKGMSSLRAGRWIADVPLGHDPQGKVLGIIGMGGIGSVFARRALGFGMRVQYFNRKRLGAEDEIEGVDYVGFEELLATSDVVSLNLPLNNNTRHIISTPEFNKMKRGVVIINTARGAVIDEAALVEAIDAGIVWSVGLDVFENEPQIHPGLLSNESVMLVPHMGTHTVETRQKMEEWTIANVRSAVETGRLKSIVKEQAGL
ncbi:hypothetical protein BU24DRAFT_386007 [Aaosphaeria arxii CBS 175.79]|uniref:Glyoxylate reductase n=1 Tax=Aaosphaeria arxii CBS 175.79 TaxID=1450172 RepID=A0A6A5Y2Y9_9PLEO|nr:uncharacterized protein BU24DRAFT_386007 [Aaosphaeria arxii CBS 175.79]KAF2019170.1 hypothetical protein BU24DRAFT_386007 [Aaosphaeria arxii CBS 175.79]